MGKAKELAEKAGTIGETARRGAHAAAEAVEHTGEAARAAMGRVGSAAAEAAKEGREALAHGAEVVKANAANWLKAPLAWAEENLLHQSVAMQLTRCLSMTFAIQLGFGFLPHLLFGTSRHRTVLAGANFLFLALFSFLTSPNWSLRQLIITGCCCAWALRLFGNLFLQTRDSSMHLKGRPGAKAVAWSAQAMYIFLSMLPIILANADAPSKAEAPGRFFSFHTRWGTVNIPAASWLPGFLRPQPHGFDAWIGSDPIGALEMFGFSIFVIGFALEVASDIARSVHKGPLPIMSGLYSRVRYPQYLGEILLWTGLALAAVRGHSGFRWLSLLSPIAVAFTTIFISGIPISEKTLDKKYSDNEQYQQWRKNTPALIPHIW